jgi:hypothetical protein
MTSRAAARRGAGGGRLTRALAFGRPVEGPSTSSQDFAPTPRRAVSLVSAGARPRCTRTDVGPRVSTETPRSTRPTDGVRVVWLRAYGIDPARSVGQYLSFGRSGNEAWETSCVDHARGRSGTAVVSQLGGTRGAGARDLQRSRDRVPAVPELVHLALIHLSAHDGSEHSKTKRNG